MLLLTVWAGRNIFQESGTSITLGVGATLEQKYCTHWISTSQWGKKTRSITRIPRAAFQTPHTWPLPHFSNFRIQWFPNFYCEWESLRRTYVKCRAPESIFGFFFLSVSLVYVLKLESHKLKYLLSIYYVPGIDLRVLCPHGSHTLVGREKELETINKNKLYTVMS